MEAGQREVEVLRDGGVGVAGRVGDGERGCRSVDRFSVRQRGNHHEHEILRVAGGAERDGGGERDWRIGGRRVHSTAIRDNGRVTRIPYDGRAMKPSGGERQVLRDAAGRVAGGVSDDERGLGGGDGLGFRHLRLDDDQEGTGVASPATLMVAMSVTVASPTTGWGTAPGTGSLGGPLEVRTIVVPLCPC